MKITIRFIVSLLFVVALVAVLFSFYQVRERSSGWCASSTWPGMFI